MAKEVGIVLYRNMIEHCKVEIHFIKKEYWTENDTPKTRYVYRG